MGSSVLWDRAPLLVGGVRASRAAHPTPRRTGDRPPHHRRHASGQCAFR